MMHCAVWQHQWSWFEALKAKCILQDWRPLALTFYAARDHSCYSCQHYNRNQIGWNPADLSYGLLTVPAAPLFFFLFLLCENKSHTPARSFMWPCWQKQSFLLLCLWDCILYSSLLNALVIDIPNLWSEMTFLFNWYFKHVLFHSAM